MFVFLIDEETNGMKTLARYIINGFIFLTIGVVVFSIYAAWGVELSNSLDVPSAGPLKPFLVPIAYGAVVGLIVGLLFARQRSRLEGYQKAEQQLKSLVKSRTAQLHTVNEALEQIVENTTGRDAFLNSLNNEWRRSLRSHKPLSIILCAVEGDGDFGIELKLETRNKEKVLEIVRGIVKRPADFVAPFGEHDFALLLPDTPLEGATTLAKNLRSSLLMNWDTFEGTENIIPLVSLGISSRVPVQGEKASCLVDSAVAALNESRVEGFIVVKQPHECM